MEAAAEWRVVSMDLRNVYKVEMSKTWWPTGCGQNKERRNQEQLCDLVSLESLDFVIEVVKQA